MFVRMNTLWIYHLCENINQFDRIPEILIPRFGFKSPTNSACVRSNSAAAILNRTCSILSQSKFLWKIWNMFGQGNFGRGDDNNHLVSWTPNTNFNECFNFDAMKMLKIKKKLRFRRHCMQMQTTNVTTLLTSNFEPVAFKIWLYVNQ